MIIKIAHIGIAVKNLAQSLSLYRDILDLEVNSFQENPSTGLKLAFLRVGESNLELLESTNPQNRIGLFIKEKGEGIHHIALQVDDIDHYLKRFKDCGYKLIDQEPRRGAGGTRIAFLDPGDTGGVLLELVEGEAY